MNFTPDPTFPASLKQEFNNSCTLGTTRTLLQQESTNCWILYITPAEASRRWGVRPYHLRLHTDHIRVWDRGPRLRLEVAR